jgi:hypothetical protein
VQLKKSVLSSRKTHKSKLLKFFSRLILSLVEEVDFAMKDLYQLDNHNFQLAIDILQEWRIDRYYMGKAKTFDTAQQALTLVKSKIQS